MHASVCDILLDITQNAIEAQADRIKVNIEHSGSQLLIRLEDNGKGMDEETLQRALDPFFTDGEKHRHRRVGLGLPFLKQVTDSTGGTLDIRSEKGKGTTVAFGLNTDHIDLPPLGNLPATVLSMMNFNGPYELELERKINGNGYTVCRSELLDALGGLETAGDLQLARQYLDGLENDLKNEKKDG